MITIGSKVKVRGTKHTPTVSKIRNGWFILKEKYKQHCCNCYSLDELEEL